MTDIPIIGGSYDQRWYRNTPGTSLPVGLHGVEQEWEYKFTVLCFDERQVSAYVAESITHDDAVNLAKARGLRT